jgi:hypothetical protein
MLLILRDARADRSLSSTLVRVIVNVERPFLDQMVGDLFGRLGSNSVGRRSTASIGLVIRRVELRRPSGPAKQSLHPHQQIVLLTFAQ